MGVTKDRLYNFVLFFLVLLSFILTFNLWTAGSDISEDQNLGSQSSRADISTVNHSMSTVFRPTNVMLHGIDEDHQILLASTYPLRNLMESRFALQDLNRVDREEYVTNEEYLERLQDGQWLEFSFREELPLGVFEQKFEELPQEMSNNFIDRILIDVNNLTSIGFYHTASDTLYRASVLEEETLDIEPFLNKENLRYLPARTEILGDNFLYLTEERLTLPLRSYVVDQLPNSVYTSNFFPDTSLVDVRSSDSVTRYIDLTKEVSINQRTNTLTYYRQIQNPGELDPSERYRRSFEQVERFENWTGTFSLGNYNREDNILSFRREIEGFPIFNLSDYESVSEIGVVESGVKHLKIPLRFSTTPITIEDSPNKELISGIEVMEQINSVFTFEDLEKIEDIMVGFSWDESEETNEVIYFIPTWYVLYDGSWIDIETLLTRYKEAAYGL